jgi:protein-tyrosine phosphatase
MINKMLSFPDKRSKIYSQSEDLDAHQIIPNLWLGNKVAAADASFLKGNKIAVVFNCTRDVPNFFEGKISGIKYYKLEVDDSLQKKDINIMTEFLVSYVPILDFFIKKKIPVLVHCWAGMQRSACMVAALLIYNRIKLDNAIVHIKKIRNIAFTPQINFIDSLLIFTNIYQNIRNYSIDRQ